MIVKLTDELYVNPEEVVQVFVKEFHEHTFVRMKDDALHEIYPLYGMSKYQNLDRIVKLVNGVK
jgi:hypothetical protein